MKRMAVSLGMAVSILAAACGGDDAAKRGKSTQNTSVYDEDAERAAFPAKTVYAAYLGNTHAHTAYSDDAKGSGTPADHYALAKENGYDFYAVTDHISVDDPSRTPYAIRDYTKMATDATTSTFVGILGMEYTNNDNNQVADGWGHINVYDSNGWFFLFDDWEHWNQWTNLGVNRPPRTIKDLYDWLCTTDNTQSVASFNHPSKTQYNSFAVYNTGALNHITMFEIYNTSTSYYNNYKTALAKGWKLAPITAMDNHALAPIANAQIRTGIMAENLAYNNVIDAFRNRRAYASMYKKLRVLCYGNHLPMGSTLNNPNVLYIDVEASNEQTSEEGYKMTKIEVIGSNATDNVIVSKTFDTSSHSVSHSFRIAAPNQAYYFLKIYSQGMGNSPCAYTAPIWMK